MMDLITSLLGGSNAIFAALGAVLMFVVGAFFKGRSSGKAAEREKQRKEEEKARTIADEIDDAVAGRSPASNREELKRWSPKR